MDGQKQPSGQPSHIPLFSHLDLFQVTMGFLGDLVVKESACNAEHIGSIPGSGRSPGEGNGNPLQYSCLGNPKDRGVWQAIVHGVTKVLDMA